MEQNNNSTEEQVQTVNYVGEEAYKALYRRLSTQIAGTKGDTEAIIANLGSMSVGDMTIRELLDAIKTDALTLQQLTEAKDAITALIGAASDSSSASTVFGKIAEAIRIISETKGDTEAIIANLGSMSVGDMTIRGLLDAIKTDALTPTQLTEANNAIISLIGAASDSSEVNTVFGKIAAAKQIIDTISTSLGSDDANDVHDKLNEILRLVNVFAYGYAITQNNDGTETYTLDLDNSASIDDSTLNIL